MAIKTTEVQKHYFEMLRIRRIEEKIIDLSKLKTITPVVHLSIGQEAAPVGICSMLSKTDVITSTHRCHAHYLAKGGSLKAMIAELAGKKGGCSGGRGGSMLLHDFKAGVLLSSALVGGSIPIAVGAAMSFKLSRKKNIAVAFLGDGAIEEGVFWESINFAVVHKLPVIFVCENNLYATHSPIEKRQPKTSIFKRLSNFDLSYVCQTKPNDVLSIAKEFSIAAKLARNGKGPSFIEIPTYRWQEHWGPGTDWHLGYRKEAEGEVWKKQCPIIKIENKLRNKGVRAEFFNRCESVIKKEMEMAINFSNKSPEPKSLPKYYI